MEVFKPLYDRVLMELQTKEEKVGDLYLAQNAQGKEANRAKVLAVGPGKYDVETNKNIPMNVKVGDVVFVNPYLGMRVKMVRGMDPLLVQKEDEILGVAFPSDSETTSG